jgi:hypothetical protein
VDSRKSDARECVDYGAQIEAVKAGIAKYERSLEIVRNGRKRSRSGELGGEWPRDGFGKCSWSRGLPSPVIRSGGAQEVP